jgi:hypothetical protein
MTIFMVVITLMIKFKASNLNQSHSEVNQVCFNDLQNLIINITIKWFRSSLFLLTVISILAVDFELFPNYFAKTDHFGISFMDIGVGFFIMSHSLRVIRNSNQNKDILDTDFKR